MKRIVVVAVVLFLAVLAVPSAMAQSAGPKVIKPDSVAFGRTYSEWSAAWQQWALSIPVVNHPLFDNGDCSVGQSGPVWFLGGKFCAINTPGCGTNNVVRTCSVPRGKALYIPILNAEWSVLEMNDPKFQIADLRSNAAINMDGAANLSFEIDGAAIPHLQDRFRVQSTAFVFTLPDDNLFNAVGEGPYTGGSYFPGVDDGVYVMLAPLPLGPHTIHFHGSLPVWQFTLDITYYLNVTK
ncbi:MAG: hypothetical protein LAO23_03325 [Acidobacteriia bacterium]|nr:hypothetical protein [Terriglobia bacterium]